MDPLDELLQQRSLAMLEQRASSTTATVNSFRQDLSRGIKLVILPFDSPENARMLVQASRDQRVPTLVVQHGFATHPSQEPDKTVSDYAAVWCERDLEALLTRSYGDVRVVTNPGLSAAGLLKVNSELGKPEAALVLVDYTLRFSAEKERRISIRQVEVALEALGTTRWHGQVIIRPHPFDRHPEVYERIAEQFPNLSIEISPIVPIQTLFERISICIAAESTATLQAAQFNVPVILLNLIGKPRNWPFDETTDVPIAHDVDELAAAINELGGSTFVPGRDVMLEALGARVDASSVDLNTLIGELLADTAR